MFERNKLEQWYDNKVCQYDISECGMVNTIELSQLSKLEELKHNSSIFDYANSKGENDLINAICAIYNCHEENILITNGAVEALFIVLLSLIDRCRTITCQVPCYNRLEHFLKKVRCEIEYFELKSKFNFNFDFEQFKSSFSNNSNLAILSFPNNPTGCELKDNDYVDIINYAENNQKILVFDETAALSLNGTYIEKNIQHHLNNCICINSMSKAYGVPGIRVGWIVASKTIIEECQAAKEIVSICTPLLLQKIAFDILQNRNYIISNNKRIVHKNVTSLKQHFQEYNSSFVISCIPENSMCCLIRVPNTVKDYEFCLKLYEEYNVLLAPGECFGLKGYFRIGLGVDPNLFDNALKMLDMFINMHCKI